MRVKSIALFYGSAVTDNMEETIKKDMEELKEMGFTLFKKKKTPKQIIVYAKKGVRGYEKL